MRPALSESCSVGVGSRRERWQAKCDASECQRVKEKVHLDAGELFAHGIAIRRNVIERWTVEQRRLRVRGSARQTVMRGRAREQDTQVPEAVDKYGQIVPRPSRILLARQPRPHSGHPFLRVTNNCRRILWLSQVCNATEGSVVVEHRRPGSCESSLPFLVSLASEPSPQESSCQLCIVACLFEFSSSPESSTSRLLGCLVLGFSSEPLVWLPRTPFFSGPRFLDLGYVVSRLVLIPTI